MKLRKSFVAKPGFLQVLALHIHNFSPTHLILISSFLCLALRGWRCIRRFLASGWVPLTRPCPSLPSRGSPPTPGEAWFDTIRDKRSRQESKRSDGRYREDELIWSRLHLNALYLFAFMPSLDRCTSESIPHAATAPCWLLMVQDVSFLCAAPEERDTGWLCCWFRVNP